MTAARTETYAPDSPAAVKRPPMRPPDFKVTWLLVADASWRSVDRHRGSCLVEVFQLHARTMQPQVYASPSSCSSEHPNCSPRIGVGSLAETSQRITGLVLAELADPVIRAWASRAHRDHALGFDVSFGPDCRMLLCHHASPFRDLISAASDADQLRWSLPGIAPVRTLSSDLWRAEQTAHGEAVRTLATHALCRASLPGCPVYFENQVAL
jgi:hypothetical protein